MSIGQIPTRKRYFYDLPRQMPYNRSDERSTVITIGDRLFYSRRIPG